MVRMRATKNGNEVKNCKESNAEVRISIEGHVAKIIPPKTLDLWDRGSTKNNAKYKM